MLHATFLTPRALCVSLTALCLWTAAAVRADEIVVEGKPMSGTVKKVTPKGLEVETTYGKGNVLVEYEDITTLRTDEPFTLIVSDQDEVVGKLVGVREGNLLVGDDPASARAVPVSALHDSYSTKKFEESGLLQMRSLMRYWKANYDLSFAGSDATVNTLDFSTGFDVERKKKPTRLVATGRYRFATIDDPDGDDSQEDTTANQLLGALRGEYDLTDRFFVFAATSAEYDEVQSLSLRLTPRAGPGIHILNSEENTWNFDISPAYVYERFFGPSENKYVAIAFGTDGSLTLPWGSTLTFRGAYLPSIEEWTNDYLLSGTAALLFPMTEWVSFKTSVTEQYDNTPAEDTSQNSVTGTVGLALVF